MRRFGLLAALGLIRREGEHPLLDRLRQRQALRDDGADDAPARRFVPPPGVTVESDLAYGNDPAQQLDVYRPADGHGAPVLLFVHGGGWRRGDKAMPRMVANKVAHWVGRGFVFASMNYRMLPAADPVEQAEDVARALAFVQREAPRWGGDLARVVLIGHSAGAHLAALVTADPDFAMRHGVSPWRATVAIDSAALDIEAIMTRRHYRFYDPVFGTDPAFWRAASPMHRLQGLPVAPMLLVCSSERDDSLPPAQAFAARATELGGRATVLPVALGHLQINDLLGADAGYTGAVDAFLQSVGVA
jgi:acetyl esterase/lipase